LVFALKLSCFARLESQVSEPWHANAYRQGNATGFLFRTKLYLQLPVAQMDAMISRLEMLAEAADKHKVCSIV